MWHEIVHMYLAGYIVAGFIVAGVYAFAWLRGRRDPYHRTALVVTLASLAGGAGPGHGRRLGGAHGRGDASRSSWPRSRGSATTKKGAPFTIGGFYDADTNELRGGIEIPKLLSLLAAPARTRRSKGSTRCRATTARR